MTSLLALLLLALLVTLLLGVLNRHDGQPWYASHRPPPRSHRGDL